MPTADDRQVERLPNRRQRLLVAQVVTGAHGASVDGDDDVTLLDARFVCRAAGNDRVDERTLNRGQTIFFGDFLIDFADSRNADATAFHFTETCELIHDAHCHVGRNGETDAHVASGRADDGGVDPDQFATQIDQRTA